MDVTDVLQSLGNPGFYHIVLLICMALCNSTVSMNHLVMAVFGYTPSHHCSLPDGVVKNETIPLVNENGELMYDQCNIISNITTGEKATCPEGWFFILKKSESSIVSEWSLVCNDKYLVGTSTTIYFAGVMLGGAIFGQLADKFGRKLTLLVCMYGHILLGFIVYFVTSIEAFATLRFFIGFFVQGIQTTSYVLLVEMTVIKYRPLFAGIFEVCWAIGNLWMTILAWAIQDWRKIQLAISLPSLVTLFYIYFVPESLRWLVSHGRIGEAQKYVKQIAWFNKKTFPQDAELHVKETSKTGTYSFHDLFKTTEMRKRTIVMGYVWLASSVGYYGLSLSAGGLAGNRFSNLFISAAVEVVAFIGVIFVLKYFNRRYPLMVYYTLGGVTCIIAGVVKQQSGGEAISKVFAVIGKFFISAAFSTIFLFTVELFPTVVRTLGMGSCVFWARVGGMVAPQILLLKDFTFQELPFLIFGVLSLLATVGIFFIPETRGINLPETIEEIEIPSGVRHVDTSNLHAVTNL